MPKQVLAGHNSLLTASLYYHKYSLLSALGVCTADTGPHVHPCLVSLQFGYFCNLLCKYTAFGLAGSRKQEAKLGPSLCCMTHTHLLQLLQLFVVLDKSKLLTYSAACKLRKFLQVALHRARLNHGLTHRRASQVEYGALDAVCLLMLLDNFMACTPSHLNTQTPSKPPAESKTAAAQTHSTAAASADCTLTAHADADKASGSGSNSDDAQDVCSDASPSASSRCRSQHPSRDEPHSGAAAPAGGSPTAAMAGASAQQASSQAQQSGQEQSGHDGQTAHQAAVKQAMEHWGCRLEMSSAGKASKPRARRHLSRRQRAHIRHAMEQQNQIDDAAGQQTWLYLLWKRLCWAVSWKA